MPNQSTLSRHLLPFVECFAILLFLQAAVTHAQIPEPRAADCTNAKLETTLHIYQAPGHMQVVALDYRNTTVAACTLRPDGGSAQGPPLTLNPGAIAHSSFRWSTQPASPEIPCHELTDRVMSVNRSPNGILLVSPTLLPHICSSVQYSAYFPGPFVPDWKIEASAAEAILSAPILTSSKQTFYQNEDIDMRLKLTSEPADAATCPVLFETIRDAKKFTRIDEIVNPKTGCHRWLPWRGPWKGPANEFDIDAGENSRWGGLGELTFTVSRLAGVAPDGELRLIPSNTVTLNILDPATIDRRWGATDKGVRIDLTLDKRSYALGRDIPLHIAAEVVSTEQPIYGEPFRPRGAFFGAFAASFHLTISDENGPLPGSDRASNLFSPLAGSSGPINCPSPISPGKIIPLERSLRDYDLLPRTPGTYKLVVSWSPYTTGYSSCAEVPPYNPDAPREKPFVTVTSVPLTIQITGEPNSVEGIPEVPDYTAWKPHFTLADTTFGEKTALLDRTTHLAWLRLSLTADLSEKAVRKEMEADGRFEGWRFATADEVVAFFAHFTAAPDGRSTDPSIERKLQRLLGGPVDSPSNPQTGWSRRSTSGRIAGLAPATYEQSPHAAGAPPPCPTCSVGFIYHYAEIYEDTQNGNINAYIDPHSYGWTKQDAYVRSSGIFLVRRK